MTLPTPTQMDALTQLVAEHGKITKGKWYTFKGMSQALERARGDIASGIVGGAAKGGLNAVSHVSTGTTIAVPLGAAGAASITLIPFAAVLAPWIAAADIVRQSSDIFELHDLKDHAKANPPSSVQYRCGCGKCFDNIKYVVDKKERNVGRIGIGVATIGISAIFTSIYSVAKSFQSGRPKEMVSRGLVDSARAGCTTAVATIFLLSGNWSFLRGGNAGIMRRAIAVMTSEDGWEVLKSSW